MTVNTSIKRKDYVGDGATDTFAIGFQVLSETHVKVYATSPDDLENPVLKILTTDYTTTGDLKAGTGSIIFNVAPADSYLITFLRSVPLTQASDYEQYANFPAETLEDNLDQLTMILQEHDEILDRCPKIPASVALAADFPLPEADASIVWNSAADTLVNGPSIAVIETAQGVAAAAVSAAAASASAAQLAQTGAETAEADAEVAKGVAEGARDLAREWAEQPEDVPITGETGKFSALHWAAKAQETVGGAHNALTARDAADCHPQSAITGLTGALAGKTDTGHTHVMDDITDYVGGATQQQADQIYLNAVRIALNGLLASGDLVSGYEWLFATDELATKTNAAYDSGGRYYTNQQSGSLQALGSAITSGFSNPGNAFDGNAATYAEGPAYGTGNTIGRLFAQTVELTAMSVQFEANNYAPTASFQYTTDNGSTWNTLVASKSFSNVDTAQTVTFTATVCNGVRMTQTSEYSNNPCRIKEFALTGTTQAMDMTLLPTAVTADAQPDDITIYFLHKSVDAVTMGTDFQVQASRAVGSWSPWEVLETDYTEVADFGEYKLWRVDCDLSGTSAGTSMRWQIKTYNTKAQRLRAVLAAWG